VVVETRLFPDLRSPKKIITGTSFDFIEFELQNSLESAAVLVEPRVGSVVGLAVLEHQVQVLVDGPEVRVLAVFQFLPDLGGNLQSY
jgi:hypothetical protein